MNGRKRIRMHISGIVFVYKSLRVFASSRRDRNAAKDDLPAFTVSCSNQQSLAGKLFLATFSSLPLMSASEIWEVRGKSLNLE